METVRLPNVLVLLLGACIAATTVFAGCGSDSEETPGDNPPDGSPGDDGGNNAEGGNPLCKPTAAQCAVDGDCCSLRCDAGTKTCLVNTASCSAPGATC